MRFVYGWEIDKLSTESKFVDLTFFVISPKRRQNICNYVMFRKERKKKSNFNSRKIHIKSGLQHTLVLHIRNWDPRLSALFSDRAETRIQVSWLEIYVLFTAPAVSLILE